MSTSPVEQFREAMHAAGIAPPNFIKTDGRLHRFPTDGTRADDAGWYVYHNGEIQAGAFGCWRGDVSETWRADIGRELTEEEEAKQRARIEADRRARQPEEVKLQANARKKAAALLKDAGPAPENHPYVARKRVKTHGLRALNGELLVRMIDTDGLLHNVQTISAEGKKLFLYGDA